jgi:hypothetical protein
VLSAETEGIREVHPKSEHLSSLLRDGTSARSAIDAERRRRVSLIVRDSPASYFRRK